jgi:hypothetical protein
LHSPKDAEQARPQVNMPCHEFKDACWWHGKLIASIRPRSISYPRLLGSVVVCACHFSQLWFLIEKRLHWQRSSTKVAQRVAIILKGKRIDSKLHHSRKNIPANTIPITLRTSSANDMNTSKLWRDWRQCCIRRHLHNEAHKTTFNCEQLSRMIGGNEGSRRFWGILPQSSITKSDCELAICRSAHLQCRRPNTIQSAIKFTLSISSFRTSNRLNSQWTQVPVIYQGMGNSTAPIQSAVHCVSLRCMKMKDPAFVLLRVSLSGFPCFWQRKSLPRVPLKQSERP